MVFSAKREKIFYSMKFIGITSTIIFFALAGWFGYVHYQKTIAPVDVSIVITSWPTAQLLRSVDQLGYFSEQGVNVKLIDVRDRYSDAVGVVSRGEADGGVFVLSEPLLLTSNGQPMRVVLGLDYSAGADGLVAAADIEDIRALVGKKVAYQPGSFGDLLLQEALQSVGLSVDQIETVTLSPADASQAFLLGEVDAAVTVEPFLSQALVRNGSRAIYSSSQSPGLLPDVLSFNAEFVNNNPDTVAAVVNAWIEFSEDIEQNARIRERANSVVAIRLGETLQSIEAEFAGIHILSGNEIEQAFTREMSPASLHQSGQRFLNFFNNRMSLDTSSVNLEEILLEDFIVNK